MFELLEDHSLLVLLALATCASYVWLLQMRERVGLSPVTAAIVAVCHTLFGVLSVMAFAIIEGFGDLSTVGNMSLFGGMFFMPLFYLAVAKLAKCSLADAFDVFTVPLVGTLLFARINCVISGCCLGSLIGDTGMRWPTREAEIVFYLVFIPMVARRILRGESKGEAFPLYMVSYGVFRFVVEFFRYSSSTFGPFHISHIWAFVAIGLGASILMEIRSSKEKKGRKKVRS